MDRHKYAIIILLLLTLPFLINAAPTRTYTYTSGSVINPDEVTTNEDNVFRYLQVGVDTYADDSIVSADIFDGTIVNADISGSAAVAYSKLNLSSSILTGDIKDGEIVNADISSSASIVDTKLAQIATASKVSGAALTSLSSVPSGAGQVPVANLGTGTGSSSNYLRGDGSWSSFTGFSNVIFCWFGSVVGTTNIFGKRGGTSLTPNMGAYTVDYEFWGVYGLTYRTILTGQFTKIAGISTITIHANLWCDAAGSNGIARLNVDVGGQSNTVAAASQSTTPTWVTTSTIDVSGLTNGNVYDITIQLRNDEAGTSAYCAGIMLVGS